MKKFVLDFIFGIYVIIAIFVTVCLLSYNEYKVTEFGNYSLIIISDDSVSENFNKGDLVIVDKKAKVQNGQNVFFYNTMSMDVEVNFGKIIDQEKITATETTYTLDGGYKISGEYLIGPEQPATVVKGVGTVLSILQSKWGFLFLIVLPALIAFLYQIGVVVSELRGTNGGKDKNYNEEQ